MQTIDLKHYTIPDIDLLAGLERAGNAIGAYLHFLQSTHARGEHYRTHLQQALIEHDSSALHQQLHGLRGVAATLGASRLAQSCLALLQTDAQAIDDISPELIGNVFHDLDRLITGINASGLLNLLTAPPEPVTPIAGCLQAFTLVFIEDDPLLKQLFIGELQKHFVHTIWLKQRQDALDYVAQQTSFRHSIILCDVKLPDGSGLDVARAIAQREPDTLIFLTSGEPIPADELADMPHSIELLKPFSINDFLNLARGLALNLLRQQTPEQ